MRKRVEKTPSRFSSPLKTDCSVIASGEFELKARYVSFDEKLLGFHSVDNVDTVPASNVGLIDANPLMTLKSDNISQLFSSFTNKELVQITAVLS